MRAGLDKRPADVAAMFDRVAGSDDLANTVLSGGLGAGWRPATPRRRGGGLAGVRPGDPPRRHSGGVRVLQPAVAAVPDGLHGVPDARTALDRPGGEQQPGGVRVPGRVDPGVAGTTRARPLAAGCRL